MKWIRYSITVLSILSSIQILQAEEFLVSIKKKQEDKYKNRWTLASWFEEKRKMRLQDMWLAGTVRKDNYEFFIGGSQSNNTYKDPSTGETDYKVLSGSFAAYATIAGLEGRYFDEDSIGQQGWEAQFKLRLLGTSLQNTNLVLGYGVRNTTTATDEYQNPIGKVLITLYLTKLFGISGEYTQVFPTDTLTGETEGYEIEAQAFLDFSLLRIFGASLTGSQTVITPTSSEETTFTGFKAGLKLFF